VLVRARDVGRNVGANFTLTRSSSPSFSFFFFSFLARGGGAPMAAAALWLLIYSLPLGASFVAQPTGRSLSYDVRACNDAHHGTSLGRCLRAARVTTSRMSFDTETMADRYLRESNVCRPIKAEGTAVVLPDVW